MADETTTEVVDGEGTAVVEDLRAAIMADLEQAETSGTPDATTEQPQAPANPTYTLPDGTQVTLEELESGYLRQSDYTKKTQTLAQQRAEAEQALRLMAALSEDPVGTLQALQTNLLGADNEEDLDPYEQQLREHEERFAQLEHERFEQELMGIVSGLENQYADRGFDRDTVLEWAVQHEIPNLEAAFLHWENAQAQAAARAAGNQQALQRKSQLPPLAGRSRQLGGDAPQFREVKNVKDAMANALLELDFQS